jgi:pilus assembly protein Flp/PilA
MSRLQPVIRALARPGYRRRVCGREPSLREEIPMKALKSLLVRLVKDEQGGEVLEYALVAGLIVVAAIAVIGSVGTKVLARWNSLNSSM